MGLCAEQALQHKLYTFKPFQKYIGLTLDTTVVKTCITFSKLHPKGNLAWVYSEMMHSLNDSVEKDKMH